MLGVSHLLISATATSLILGTSNSAIIMVGAVAGLLPDVDISISPAGRVLPWISRYLERRMPHRSCTHSLIASGLIAVVTYAATFFLGDKFLGLAHALNIGYFFGWFADVFTRSGVEMFYPSSVRWVMPANRNFRLSTGSSAEYGVLVFLCAIAFSVFTINNKGGILTQFNRLIASPSGVEQIYNQSGATHLITAHIKGVRASDRSKVLENFLIIQAHGQGFIVQSPTGKIYKAGTEPDAQIKLEQITADVGKPAITNIEMLVLDELELAPALAPFNRNKTMVFITGQITIDDPESVNQSLDPYQFSFMKASGGTINLEAAPLQIVIEKLGDQFATGQLQLRIINANA